MSPIAVHTPVEFDTTVRLDPVTLLPDTAHVVGKWTRDETLPVGIQGPAHITFNVSEDNLLLTEGSETSITVNFSEWTDSALDTAVVPNIQTMIAKAYSSMIDSAISDWDSMTDKYIESELNGLMNRTVATIQPSLVSMFGGSASVTVKHVAHIDNSCDILFSQQDGTFAVASTQMERFIKSILMSVFHASGTQGSDVGKTVVSSGSLEIHNKINFEDSDGAVYQKYKAVSNLLLTHNVFVPM